MKGIITYSLLILVLIAFNYKTIDYFLKIDDSSIVCIQECDAEEKNSGSEKSSEKNEKKEGREYLLHNKAYDLSPSAQLSFKQHSKLLFASSDYSMAVFSPPETAVI